MSCLSAVWLIGLGLVACGESEDAAAPVLEPSPKASASFPPDWLPDGLPIAFLDVQGPKMFSSTVTPGSPEVHLAGGAEATFAPDGSAAAVRADWDEFWIQTPESEHAASVRVKGGRIVYGPAWSPDSHYLALLTMERSGNGLLIVDGATGEALHDYPLPADLFAAYQGDQLDSFRWSPDGSHLLIAWGHAAVVDAETGDVQYLPTDQITTSDPVLVSGGQLVVSTWSPDGKSVLYLGDFAYDPEDFTGLYRWRLGDAEAQTLATGAQLAEAGMVPQLLNTGQMTLAPDGSKVAVALGDHVWVFAVAADGSMDISHPIANIPTDSLVARLDWSPDSRSLAALRLDQPHAMSVDVADLGDGEWQELAVSGLKIDGPNRLDAIAGIKVLSWST